MHGSRRGAAERREKGTSKAAMEGGPDSYVYQEISNAILEQRLKPGTKLGEQQLSDIFQVNRPVVRRALMRLSYENLVDTRPNRGAFVASPTPDEARQVFEGRRVIEDWIARSCVERIDEDTLTRLRTHAKTESETVARGERVQWVRLSGKFHLELAEIAGNARLHDFLEDLIAQTSLIISLYGNSSETLCCSDEHGQIVEAIASGDPETAARTMREHLGRCEEALRFDSDHDTDDLRAIFAPFDGAGASATANRGTAVSGEARAKTKQ